MRVAGGVIIALEPHTSKPAGASVVDVHGMYLLPGGIDVHVHSRDPGFPQKEDFGTLTAAAAAGGVTTVIDMPNTVPAVDSAGMLESKAALARSRARVDFGLWGLVRSTSTPDQLRALAAAGATGFKAYLGYGFNTRRKQVLYALESEAEDLEPPPDYGTLTRLGPVIAEIGLPLAVHAEDPGVLASFRRPLTSYADVLAARPPEAEAIAITASAAVARQFGVHLHVCHVSSALGVAAAREAIGAGTAMTVETCPQFLWVTEADYPRLGTAMKMNPPVRRAADRDALREAVREGLVTIVGTDHAPHADEEKARDLETAPPGTPGVQTLYLSCLQLGQEMGDVWLAPRLVAEAPARLAGLSETKGRIAAGFDADLVVIDPRKSTTFTPALMRSRQRHGALNGMKVEFSVRATYLRGRPVFRNGRLAAASGGRMVRPG